jgi:hypothetical protein
MPDFGKLKVHPAAARFPLLDENRLQEMADRIAQRGLQQPIVLTADGQTLVDGRNRYLACQIAGVKPTFSKLPERFTDLEIIEYIETANLERRDLNPGQRAMIVLEFAPELEAAAKDRQRKAGGDKKSVKAKK